MKPVNVADQVHADVLFRIGDPFLVRSGERVEQPPRARRVPRAELRECVPVVARDDACGKIPVGRRSIGISTARSSRPRRSRR